MSSSTRPGTFLLGATTLAPAPGSDARAPSACADRLCRALSEAGLGGLLVAPPWDLSTLPALVAVAARHGLAAQAALGPLAEGALRPGKRLPRLAAHDDREELRAAVALAARALAALGDLGATVLALDLGPVPLALPETALHDAFARGELDRGVHEHPALARARAERQALGARLFDAARAALERLSPPAERAGITLALCAGGSLWRAPSPREALALCEDLAGAPLAIALDTGAWAVLDRLGLTAGAERLRALLRRAALLVLHDAVGLDGDLAPGLGEAHARWAPELPSGPAIRAGALRALGGRADTRPDELARARDLCAPLPAPTPPTSAG